MKLEQFARHVSLRDKTEIERVELIAFYIFEHKRETEVSVNDVCSLMVTLGFAQPNTSRLKANIRSSQRFIRGKTNNSFRLSVKTLTELSELFPGISETEEIVSDDSLLPEVLFEETKRGYLIKVAQQINATYENNLFDACALMMRRLLEILLIHCFENAGIENDIKDTDGNYQNLKTLINKAETRTEISLSNNVKKELHEFRELGNLSAHRVKYNCRRGDIRPNKISYRAVIEELLYASGLVIR